MIGTSRAEYCFIRFCIFALHYIAPLSITYCLFIILRYGLKGAVSPFPLFVEVIAVAETFFYLLVHLPLRTHLQREAVHPPAPSREEREVLFERCRRTIEDPERYVRKWFLGSKLEDVKRDNLKELYLWAFFNRGGPPGDDDEELEGYVDATEGLLGRRLAPGRGKAKSLRLTLDEVVMLHRSLIWYFCVGFVDFLTYTRLLYHGFRFHRTSLSRFFTLFPFRFQTLLTPYRSPAKHLTYWSRPHTSTTELPMVFIHGIGIGLYPYTKFLNELNSNEGIESTTQPNNQVGIIAIEIMPVSFRITHPALSREQMCKEIDQILTKEFGPHQKFVLVSHSYGTVISTHLLKSPSTADRIGPVMLIDPVNILLHLPEVAYNFTRREPCGANEHQLHYFASMDMFVSHTLSRHFFWSENVLWIEDMAGRRITTCLSGKDLIVDTKAVAKYLLSDRLRQSNDTSVKANGSGDTSQSSFQMVNEDPESEPLLSQQHTTETNEQWKHQPWQGTDIDVLWFEGKDHSQIFDTKASRKRLIGVIKKYCAEI